MAVTSQNGEWVVQVEQKALLLRSQIREAQRYAAALGDDSLFENLAAPYFEQLAQIYSEDLLLARAIDTSDLLLRFDGTAFSGEGPRISLVSGIFTKVRQKVGSVAHALSGLIQEASQEREIDLEVSAFAPGSLYLGFNLLNPATDGRGTVPLLGETDPLYQAKKSAIRLIGIVSQKVASGATESEATRDIEDPLVKDMTLSAVQSLAPSGKNRITSVMIMGREMPDKSFAQLTPAIKKELRQWLIDSDADSSKPEEIRGVIREIDLDIRRFFLRRIEGHEVKELRCTYPSNISDPNLWLDKEVIASGSIDRNKSGVLRVMHIVSLKGVSDPAQIELFEEPED